MAFNNNQQNAFWDFVKSMSDTQGGAAQGDGVDHTAASAAEADFPFWRASRGWNLDSHPPPPPPPGLANPPHHPQYDWSHGFQPFPYGQMPSFGGYPFYGGFGDERGGRGGRHGRRGGRHHGRPRSRSPGRGESPSRDHPRTGHSRSRSPSPSYDFVGRESADEDAEMMERAEATEVEGESSKSTEKGERRPHRSRSPGSEHRHRHGPKGPGHHGRHGRPGPPGPHGPHGPHGFPGRPGSGHGHSGFGPGPGHHHGPDGHRRSHSPRGGHRGGRGDRRGGGPASPFDVGDILRVINSLPIAKHVVPFLPPAYQQAMADTPGTASKEPNNDDQDHFAPPLDLYNTSSHFIIHISLPGARKEDIGVNWDDSKSELSIAGVIYRPGGEELSTEQLVQSERKTGFFERKLRLPPVGGCGGEENDVEVDEESINAKLEDGVLVVKVGKKGKERREGKKVDVN